MSTTGRNLPLSTVTFVFGMLSLPLAFARHLVSLALVLGLLALLFGSAGMLLHARRPGTYTAAAVNRARWGSGLALLGTVAAVVMWYLWARNLLF
jgi:hypothetical protein